MHLVYVIGGVPTPTSESEIHQLRNESCVVCDQKHLLPALGNIRASKFGTDDFNEYKRQRLKETAESAGERTTINREVQAVVSSFLPIH